MPESLSWIDLVWLIGAGACLTLALVHGGTWLRERSLRADFWFAISAFGLFWVALIELGEMRATTPERFLAIHYWIVPALFLPGIGLACFVPAFFHAGRRWLLLLALGLRMAVLLVHLVLPNGINYAAVPAIDQIHLGGGAVASVALGVHTHWTHLDELAWTVSILLTADAMRTALRRSPPEGRGRIFRVGGAILFVYLLGVPLSALVHAGIVHSPYFVTPFFVAMLGAMGNELASDAARTNRMHRELELSRSRLRISEQELELAADAAGLGIATLDVATGELVATARWRRLVDRGETDALHLEDLLAGVHPDDRERVREAIAVAAATGGTFEQEYRYSRPDGGWRWLASRGHASDDGDGVGPFVRGVTYEITSRRHAEERFRRVFDAAQSALLIVGSDGRVELANVRAESCFGYTRDELLGMPVERLLPERLREPHARQRAAYAAAPRARAMGVGRDLLARRKDGSEFPVEVGLGPLPGSDGESVLAAVVDVSERQRAELESARQRGELAHLSRVAVLGELSASLAHELNQPLAAILSNAQTAQLLLGREPLDLAELREIVDDIVSDDRRAGEVIRRLRAMLRKEELVHVPLDLNLVVLDVLQIMNSDFINRGVQVETRLARRLPEVAGDRVQLQQVLLNLLLNGCEAMLSVPRPRRLEVATRRVAGAVELAVTDGGVGIPEAELERVFEPFVTSKPQGTGLGLAVCRTIVGAHQGSIAARRNAGGAGVTVVVRLPAAPADTAA